MNFLTGTFIGLVIAAPIGPMAMLCMQRTVEKGRVAGTITGLGVAVADLVYAFFGVFLSSLAISFLDNHKLVITVFSSIILFVLGFRLMNAQGEVGQVKKLASHHKHFIESFLLTLSNPMTLLAFGAVSASIAIYNSWLFVFGIFLGSFLWWFIIVNAVHSFRHKLSEKNIKAVNTFAGLIVIFFAVSNIARFLLVSDISYVHLVKKLFTMLSL